MRSCVQIHPPQPFTGISIHFRSIETGALERPFPYYAGSVEVVTKLSSGDGRRTQLFLLTLTGFGIVRFRSCALSGVMKRLRQFGCAEHVCDALQVVCHRREADFDLCTGQPAHQQTRMSEDTVLNRSEGDARPWIGAASSLLGSLSFAFDSTLLHTGAGPSRVSGPVCSVTSANRLRSRRSKPCTWCNDLCDWCSCVAASCFQGKDTYHYQVHSESPRARTVCHRLDY
jgi:hypothetical protein